MHRDFKKALGDARGDDHWVIVIFLDVREFSAFNEEVESVQAALFIKKAYERILEDYFPTADFFKPTGDGLMIVIKYEEPHFAEVWNAVITTSLNLIGAFATIVDKDPMVNFIVPSKVGIGVARGAACRLFSTVNGEEKTLDYSGRLLNLTGRLVDLARPQGLVLHDKFGVSLLAPEVQELFSPDKNVFIRGIAEEVPITVFYTRELTKIPVLAHTALREPDIKTQRVSWTRKEIKQITGNYVIHLAEKPSDPTKIKVWLIRPKVLPGGAKHKSLRSTNSVSGFQYNPRGPSGTPDVRIDFAEINRLLTAYKIKGAWRVTIQVEYPAYPAAESGSNTLAPKDHLAHGAPVPVSSQNRPAPPQTDPRTDSRST